MTKVPINIISKCIVALNYACRRWQCSHVFLAQKYSCPSYDFDLATTKVRLFFQKIQ